MGGDTFQCIQRCSSPFHLRLGQTTQFIMLLWESHQSSAQWACYLPSLSQHLFVHLDERSKFHWSALFKDSTHGRTRGSNSRPWNHESGALPLIYACLLSYACQPNVSQGQVQFDQFIDIFIEDEEKYYNLLKIW